MPVLSEELRELLSNDLEPQNLRSGGYQSANTRSIEFAVLQQPLRNRSELRNRTRKTRRVRKCQPVDGAVSADAWDAAKQGVSGYLPGHETRIELQHDFVPRDLPQIIRVRQLFLQHSQFLALETDLRKKPPPSAP